MSPMNSSNANSYTPGINDDHNEYDIDIKYYDYKDKDHKGKQYTWEPVFENWNDWKGWKKGKYTPFQYRVYHERILRDRLRTVARITTNVTFASLLS
ncbi:uncharacterized protein ARMOST_07134 [Armillaria ostoyae]|uniref:Uncharacterized protein n=1 Tax=Armillaria ostoyae TaxID=47428 RepID=A0A284R4X7_ARMOS|nr:uncharacterized protein ARMOST_07134 [Armillaria ostoyae]